MLKMATRKASDNGEKKRWLLLWFFLLCTRAWNSSLSFFVPFFCLLFHFLLSFLSLLFFLFFYVFFSPFSFLCSPLLLFVCLLFFALFLPFFISLSLCFCLLSPGIYKGEREETKLLPMSNHGTRVRWLGQSLCSRPRITRRACPLCLFHHGRRPWRGVGGVVFFGQKGGERGRDRRCKGMEEKPSSPVFVR